MGVIASDTFSRGDGPLVDSTTETGGLVWTLLNNTTGFTIEDGKVVGPVTNTNGNLNYIALLANATDEPITISALIYPQDNTEYSGGGLYLGPRPTTSNYNAKGFGIYVTAGVAYQKLYLATRISNYYSYFTDTNLAMPPGMILETGIPILVSMSVALDNTVTIHINNKKVFSSIIAFGSRPFIAAVTSANSNDKFGTIKIDDVLVTVGPIPIIPTFGKAPLAIESSSIVDIIGTSRCTKGNSSIVLETSSQSYTNTSIGASAFEVYSSSDSKLISGFAKTFSQDWTESGGLDGPVDYSAFEYPEGMSVDLINIPDDPEVSGSLLWPSIVLPDYGNHDFPVNFSFNVQHDSEISFWAKSDIGSSQNNYFILYIDGVFIWYLNGVHDWESYSQIIPAGMHEFSFKYMYRYYSDSNENKVWLAKLRISFVKDPISPIGFSTSSSSSTVATITPYDGEDSTLQIPITLTGIIVPDLPEPIPPVEFIGIVDPTIAPTVTKSNTAIGNLPSGVYQYSYAAWVDSEAQATAPSPWSEPITLTTDDTITLTYPVIQGSKGYIVYRKEEVNE